MNVTTVEDFNALCDKLDELEGNQAGMYCSRTSYSDGVFSYEYDGLCLEFLRFNKEGTVDVWHDCFDGKDTVERDAEETHESADAWLAYQFACVSSFN